MLVGILAVVCVTFASRGCSSVTLSYATIGADANEAGEQQSATTSGVYELPDKFSMATFTGDDKLDELLASGGASSEKELISFLKDRVLGIDDKIDYLVSRAGCSTYQVASSDGGYLYGRNYDFLAYGDGLILTNRPNDGYPSISTVDTTFIRQGIKNAPESIIIKAALYTPLDGMNEKGLCVSILNINDSDPTNQDTDKADVICTAVVRMLLDKAATVDEAVEMLGEYNMHSMLENRVQHFLIADAEGNSVAVEWVNDDMVVVPSKVLTNFYIAEGEEVRDRHRAVAHAL